MNTTTKIETKHLLIREFQTDDWLAVHSYATDSEVFRYQHWGPNSEDDSREFVKMTIDQQTEVPRRSYELAIIEKSSNKLIGAVGIRIKSSTNRDADMGYTLGRSRWGNGFGTEAAQAILNFGFTELNLHRIWATAAPENLASIRVLEKVGMKYEGLLKENLLVRGRWRDSVLMAILENDWEPSVSREKDRA